MKLLHLHASEFMYKTREKALKKTPDPPGAYECTGSCLVTFITVEDGDSVYTVEAAVRDILDVASRVKAEEIILYPYAHLSPRLAPPRTAHKILVALEEEVKKALNNIRVHRSPFGWYKEFRIHVLGHPLSELSRGIEDEAVYKPGMDKLKEKHGSTLSQPRLSKDAEASAERLGFKPITPGGQAILHQLAARSASTRIEPREAPSPKSRLTLLLKSCRDGVAYTTREGTILPQDARTLGLEEPDNHVVEPIGEDGFIYPGLASGEVYMYNTGETLIPYKARAAGRECIDTWSLTLALIDERVKNALAGGPPPMLPWPIAPVHYAVIPVAEGQKPLAGQLAERLASLGLRTMLLDDTSTRLGARIRKAGKMWSMVTLVIGEKEAADGVAVVRRRWEPGRQEAVKIEEIIEEALAHVVRLYGLRPEKLD